MQGPQSSIIMPCPEGTQNQLPSVLAEKKKGTTLTQALV